jgi:hypothetical protein
MSEKQIYAYISPSECTQRAIKEHTGVGLVSRLGCSLLAILSSHYPQTNAANIPDLGPLAVEFLCVARNQQQYVNRSEQPHDLDTGLD